MKKAIIIFFVSIFCMSSQAQTYNKMLIKDTTTWQHFGIIYGVKSAQMQNMFITNSSIAAIDTVTIGSYLYKKLYELSVPAFINYSNKMLVGYIREDSVAKKVFFKETLAAPEFVLYDFSLNVNDSTLMNFPNNPSANGYYRVDSIITKTELCGPRKHFYFRKHQNNSNPSFEYFEFVESIGSTYHFLYRYYNGFMSVFFNYQPGCYHKWELGLACKKNKSSQQYQSCTYNSSMWTNFTNSCTYYYFSGGLNEHALLKGVSVYPNPANDKVFLSFYIENGQAFEINIIDVLGKIIQSNKNVSFYSGQNTFELSTSQLKSGVYSIVISNKEHKSTYPLIIKN